MTKKTRYFMAGSAAVLAAGLGTGLIAYYTGGFQPVSASAVANELRYMPADVKMLAYVDVRAIMDSELRARLKQALPMPEQGQKEFQEQTGIDIEHDIDYVVAALASDAEQARPLVVARGRFNDTQLEGLIREHGGTVEEYKGKRVVAAPAGHRPKHAGIATDHIVLAFLEPGLVAFGDATAVRTAIDAQLTSHSVTSNNEMMELVTDIGRNNNAWAVGRFDLLAAQAKLPAQISQPAAPGEVVRGGRSRQRRRLGQRPRRSARRCVRGEPARRRPRLPRAGPHAVAGGSENGGTRRLAPAFWQRQDRGALVQRSRRDSRDDSEDADRPRGPGEIGQ